MKSLYRGAQKAVTFGRLVNAALHGAFAVLLIRIALWIAMSFEQGVLAIFVGLWGAAIGVKGLEIFLSTKSQEHPDERARYLQSRSLYNPGGRREAPRRERDS